MSKNESLPIQVKAGREGFTLVIHQTAPFESILEYMTQRMSESQDFFGQSEISLDLRSRPLRTDEIAALCDLLTKNSKLKLVEVRLSDEVRFSLDRSRAAKEAAPAKRRSVPKDVEPVIVRNTCRSGARVVSATDCVVLGDVNPGAEIIAAGDIIVFGNLRGLAHAGATGDRSARIWALSIEPNQLRIADLVAVPPCGNKPVPKRYEIAEIRENQIAVSTM